MYIRDLSMLQGKSTSFYVYIYIQTEEGTETETETESFPIGGAGQEHVGDPWLAAIYIHS